MTRNEVIERFCKLSADVGKFFRHAHANDCFCGDHAGGITEHNFQFEEVIMQFIENSVQKEIKKILDT